MKEKVSRKNLRGLGIISFILALILAGCGGEVADVQDLVAKGADSQIVVTWADSVSGESVEIWYGEN
ncbi:MAG: hypothetical protein JXR63_13000, partial [Spirochaetales bacterium]|nr:hypothetical protein [Spirochaetales bacterium]